MITSAQAYELFLKWVNEPVTGYVSEEDFEDYFHSAQIEHASWLIGKKQGYKIGAPEPAVHLAATLDVAMSLSVLRKVFSSPVSNGFSNFNPGDLFHGPVDVSITGSGSECQGEIIVNELIPLTQLNDDEWSKRTRSYIRRPTLKNPVWSFFENTRIRVAPMNISHVYITYYKNPPRIDVSAGTDPVWHDADTMLILWRALKQAGLNMTDDLSIQMGSAMERNES